LVQFHCFIGKLSVEGRILNKFDVRPHSENLENYRKICRERTKKYMVKSRQIKVCFTLNIFSSCFLWMINSLWPSPCSQFQVIDNDTGSHMMPMPGMIISGLAVLSFFYIFVNVFSPCFMWRHFLFCYYLID
jgi:transcription initiation factor TFIIF subunit beta